MTDQTKLRELAESARSDSCWHQEQCFRGEYLDVKSEEARFATAASPEVVLALLDEIAALEAAVEWEWAVDYTVPRGRTYTNGLRTFRDETHARLAAAELLDGKLIRRRRAGAWEIVR